LYFMGWQMKLFKLNNKYHVPYHFKQRC
jgi:hypothetical protein